MKTLADEKIRRLFLSVILCFLCGSLLFLIAGKDSPLIALLSLLLSCAGTLFFLLRFFSDRTARLGKAEEHLRRFLAGERELRISCEAEGPLNRFFHQVNALAAILSAQADNEQRGQTFLREMISDISHQLKTPLAALNIYNGILDQETADQPELHQFILLSESELDRMDRLVQNLLKLAKLGAGTVVLEKQPENLAEIFRDVKEHFAWREEQEGKEILISGPEELLYPCSRVWLTEALENLCKNALDHTQAGDRIDLTWEAGPGCVKLTVADTGCGIHPEDLYHIFKRFYRSRFSKDSSGAGLGLPLARSIIEEHGGTIEAESELGKGAVFSIWLPFPSKL